MNGVTAISPTQPSHPVPQSITSHVIAAQDTFDGVPTLWVAAESIREVMATLKVDYALLHDLFAIDERLRQHRQGQPDSDFTIVYHLMSFSLNADVRIKVALIGDKPSIASICDVWAAAN